MLCNASLDCFACRLLFNFFFPLMGLQGYAMMFESQNIRLEALLSMGHEDLEALGIRSFGHRKAILQAFSSYVQMYLHSCDLAAQHAGL